MTGHSSFSYRQEALIDSHHVCKIKHYASVRLTLSASRNKGFAEVVEPHNWLQSMLFPLNRERQS